MATIGEGIDWLHATIASISSVIGGAAGLVAATWRLARIEPALRLDIKRDIAGIENELRDEINVGEKRISAKIEEAAQLFDETLKALRQKINDVELETARGFISKPHFDDFRREYREDMRRLMDKIDEIARVANERTPRR